MTSVKSVSKCIIAKSSTPISNLKLQKLLYYVQGWSLALKGEQAFYELIEAWAHGPVVPAAFYEYRHFGWNPIQNVAMEEGNLSIAEVEHVENVLNVYGTFTAKQLEDFSHEESPWIDARGGLPPNAVCRKIITHESMRAFFTARING